MYLKHWKLVRRPFEERLDPTCYFGSAHHQGVLIHLRSLVSEHTPIVLLAGDVGCGKSTVASALAHSLPVESHPVHIVPVAPGTADGILELMLNELQQAKLNQHLVMIIDGFYGLAECEFRELVASLQSGETPGKNTSTTILIGSTELLVLANRLGKSAPGLFPQLVLGAMAPADSIGYISHRLRLAGGDGSLFTREAISLIHELSGGIPRRINRLCDLCLLIGFSQDRPQISESIVWTAQRELRVLAPTRTATAPATRRWRQLRRTQASTLDR